MEINALLSCPIHGGKPDTLINHLTPATDDEERENTSAEDSR
jgi:hypothetical protein